MATLGNRLRLLREEKGLKQKEVGGLLGVKESSIGKYEYDQRTPSPNAINKLADYFQVSADFLLGRSDIRLPADRIIAEHKEMMADLPDEDQKMIRKIVSSIREQNKPSKLE